MTVMMSVAAMTAEWNCTRCGSTNRKLVPTTTTSTRDRCNHCRAWQSSSRRPAGAVDGRLRETER